MEEATGRHTGNTDFRKVGGVLAWLAGVASPLFGLLGMFSRRSQELIGFTASIGYATFIVGTLLFFSVRGKGPGIALLVLAVVAWIGAAQVREPGPLLVFWGHWC